MQKGGDEAGAQAAFSGIAARSRKFIPAKPPKRLRLLCGRRIYTLRLL